ncbi:RecQ family ATP-dependent DNA helicase [Vibrio sp. RE86]|uniref:RecQ family ATP-dependent DNA helicase n=1 Tax=Vibrio sp. RE86 TaxID=2607605 RepID=UPI00149387AC|nr:RecQ family ATP-dependent DNA helicase [Vibrio sp. RE86]NOH81155.1 RecQ family ATP-dependent DNA helicase [Vibrio sp. RE86]
MQSSPHAAQIEQTLISTFGFDQLRGGQQQVIDTVLSNRSCAAIFPTGSGKSLCYQLPALCLPHLTIVVSPLLALMKDQLAFLHERGIAAASIDSTQSREQTQATMNRIRQGELKILMISVERLKNERFRQFISQVPISLLVVDEAHCISEWGHNFRPDYLKLPQYLNELNIPQALLLTATATTSVVEDMQRKFAIEPNDIVVTGFYRSNLDISILPCEDSEKGDKLLEVLRPEPNAPTVVYVTLQNSAESVAELLRSSGHNAMAYHAGLASDVRETIQNQFMAGDVDCIVATIAFGMGVDKSNIRRVIHFDLPKSVENYAQEIGRAGRDGQRSQCILLGNQNGISTLENFIFGDTPELQDIKHVLEQAERSSPQWEIVLSRLANECNIRQLPLKTLLVYMEMAGLIEAKYSYFADYRFKFIKDKEFIVNQFDPVRRQFVQALFDCSTKAKVWCQVDFDALWQHFQGERQRAVAALDYFHEKGWVELESKLMTEVYQVKPFSKTTHQYAEELWQLFCTKEKSDVARIDYLLNFFQSSQCLSHELASYFGDNAAPNECGHCSVCHGQVAQLPKPQSPVLTELPILDWLNELETKAGEQLSTTLQAKFLCGIATPKFTRLKARSLVGFGRLESVPFSDVIEWINQTNID